MSCMPPSMCSAIAPVSAVRLQSVGCAVRAWGRRAGTCSGQLRKHAPLWLPAHACTGSTSSAPAQRLRSHAHDVGHGVHKDLAIANLACKEAVARIERLASAVAHPHTPNPTHPPTHPPVCAELAMMRTTVSTWPLHARRGGRHLAGRTGLGGRSADPVTTTTRTAPPQPPRALPPPPLPVTAPQ